MKKKIVRIAVLALCMFALAACGNSDPTTADYNGYSYDSLHSNCQEMVKALVSMSEEDKDYYRENGAEIVVNLIANWDEAVAEYGDFVDFGDFEITKSGKTLTAAQTVHMENRDLVLTYVYTYYSMEVEDITVDGVYSVGEKMSKALMNTVMGICIVFCVLVLICLIITCFNIFPYLEKKKADAAKAKALRADASAGANAAQGGASAGAGAAGSARAGAGAGSAARQAGAAGAGGSQAGVPLAGGAQSGYLQPGAAGFENGELVAVITAAVAAAMSAAGEVPADGFLVRSIRRR